MDETEARDAIIEAARQAKWYWSTQVPTETTCEDRISGALFTFLAALDGAASLPSCDIIVLESDEEGNTIGETRVSTMLHEFFYERTTA